MPYKIVITGSRKPLNNDERLIVVHEINSVLLEAAHTPVFFHGNCSGVDRFVDEG
jgi:hypothetical protein